jgi:ABC-type branched-subunit amino acid transport system substrate-binding protein
MSASIAIADAKEILLGQSVPYSGPASAYGVIGKAQVAYFQMVNDNGGINGNTVKLLSEDDGYSPPRAIEVQRKFVEQDKVDAIFTTLGTPGNAAIQPYLNQKKIPHIAYSGAARFTDPAKFPWTISYYPSYKLEGAEMTKHVLKQNPDAKIAVLYQNDDFGKDYLHGIEEFLGDDASKRIVAQEAFDLSEPTVNSQMSTLAASGADVFFILGSPKPAAQAIRRAGELGWGAQKYVVSVSSSINSVLQPAGLENAKGAISTVFMKDPTSPDVQNDEDVKRFKAFLEKYMPGEKVSDFNMQIAFLVTSAMEGILRSIDGEVNSESIMKAATHWDGSGVALLLPGIEVKPDPETYQTFRNVRMQQFDGEKWIVLGQ